MRPRRGGPPARRRSRLRSCPLWCAGHCRFSRGFYGHLSLLHGSLALRVIGGDLAGSVVLWQWGGALNEAAIVLFLAASGAALARARRGARRTAARPARAQQAGPGVPIRSGP